MSCRGQFNKKEFFFPGEIPARISTAFEPAQSIPAMASVKDECP